MANRIRQALTIIALLGVCASLLAREQSQAEMDAACEAAREQRLAPLREAEISDCKKDKSKERGYCEQF